MKKKNEAAKEYTQKVELDKISLPLKKNDVVGKLKVFDGNNLIGKYDLIVNKNVSKKNFLQILGDNLRDIVVGRLSF